MSTHTASDTRSLLRAAHVMVALAVVMLGCSSGNAVDSESLATSSPDVAETTTAEPVPTSTISSAASRVLTIAHIDAGSGLDPATMWFSEALAAESGGALTAEFRFECCGREVDVEQALLEQVKSGDADLGWVGVRSFAQAGTTAFEPLIAPLLVRSYAAERAIIESEVANGLLARLESLGLVGLGLLPGGLRYPMSSGAELTTPADWEGLQIYTFESSIAAASIVALGAEPQLLGFDARDDRLADGSIAGLDNTLRFHADRLDTFTHVVGDLPLWTRMSALVAAPGLQLNPDERQWITAAVADVAARTEELADIDRAAVAEACALDDPGYALAGPEAMRDFESALAPVRQTLADSPDSAATLEALDELVADIPSAPAATCESTTEIPDTSGVTLRTLIDRPIETPSLQGLTNDGEATGPVTYASDGLTISARLTLPSGSGPFPAVVLVQPFGGLERAAQSLIDAGYAVLETDLRGHGESDADPSLGSDLDMGSTLDIVNAARALGSDPRIDSSRIALIGAGLAGLLVINAQVVAPDAVGAVVASNPSSLDLWQNIEYFLEPADDLRDLIVQSRGTPDDNPGLWADVSPTTFLDRVDSPLLVLQGTVDTFNEPAWANETVEAFRAAGKDARLTVLEGADFTLAPAWDQASSEIEAFLAESL